jgi:class 3 adenylate cyclase
METTIKNFKPKASLPKQGIVVLFDLEGFSKFFSQPDVQDYVPKYLNIILNAVDICFNGGEQYWSLEKNGNPIKIEPLPKCIHSKFLGDGGLYIFDYKSFDDDDRAILINRLWNLKNNFDKIVEKATEEIPILDIPKRIRFGISSGTIYRLTYSNSNNEEFIGYSINLASRLQSYCRQIGLIASGRINIKTSKLAKHSYIKVVAKNIKGFPQEIVIVDKDDYEDLDKDTKESLFDLI